ncbi:MAG: DNA repair protein RecO [Chloroflexota bacterium]|nr:DNA repair protein RecO [Chloroflexota bacterium]
MRDRLYRVEAIVLKRSDFGEADRLLTLYTPDLGKIRAIAKGARKPSSRKSGHVELFTHSALLLAKGRHLDIVTQADTLDAFVPLRENLERLGLAYYLAELVDRFVAEGDLSSQGESFADSDRDEARDGASVENRPLFDLLLHALKWLGDDATDPALLARYFELHLLQHVGYRPQLFNCVNCGTVLEPVDNYFSADAGGVIDPNCVTTQRDKLQEHARDLQPLSLNALKVLRYLQTREWETVRALRLSADTHAEVETLTQRYVAHHLERNLKSVDFLRTLKQSA